MVDRELGEDHRDRGGLAGVIGVYFGFKGWKRKKPTYLIHSITYSRAWSTRSGCGGKVPWLRAADQELDRNKDRVLERRDKKRSRSRTLSSRIRSPFGKGRHCLSFRERH